MATWFDNYHISQDIFSTLFNGLPIPSVDGVLVRPFRHRCMHRDKTGNPEDKKEEEGKEFDTDLDRARLCVTLMGRFGPQSIGIATVASKKVPSAQSNWSTPVYHGSVKNEWINDGVLSRVKENFTQLCALDQRGCDHITVALRMLNEFESVADPVRKSIAMRVALESLFLGNEKSELRYRLGLNAAFFLGSTYLSRKHIFRCVQNAYDIGSAAVHTGRVDEKAANSNQKILDDAAEIVREAVLLMLRQPKVSFSERIFHAGIEPN